MVKVTKVSTTQLVSRDEYEHAEAVASLVRPILDELIADALATSPDLAEREERRA